MVSGKITDYDPDTHSLTIVSSKKVDLWYDKERKVKILYSNVKLKSGLNNGDIVSAGEKIGTSTATETALPPKMKKQSMTMFTFKYTLAMTGTATKWLTQDSLSIIKTERQFDMKETTKRKLKRLHQKLDELEERMKKDAIDKRAIQKQIQDIESTEIFNMIRKGGLSLEIVCDDLELGKKLRESGITASEIAEMITSESNTETTAMKETSTTPNEKERNFE